MKATSLGLIALSLAIGCSVGTMPAVLQSAAEPSALPAFVSVAHAQNPKAALENFKYRTDDAYGRVRVSVVGTVTNKSNSQLEASICWRGYDNEGFEVERDATGKVILAPGQSDSATRTTASVSRNDWSRVVLLKAYVARFGCSDSPAEALSPIVQVKTANPTQ